jgi:integrase
MAHVEDRWYRTVKGPDGEKHRERSARYGTGLRWRVRYLGPDGREHGESFGRRVDADKFKVAVEADVQRGTYVDPDAGKITLRRYAEDVFLPARGWDAVTREAAESRIRLHILPRLGDKRLAELAAQPSLIQAWVNALKMAPTTAGKVFTHLNSIMIAAQTDGLITRNPCKAEGIRLPKVTRRRITPWTPAQAAAVRAELDGRYQAIIDAGTGLGLRQSELFGLAAGEIEFMPGRVVHVRQQVKMIGWRPHFAPPKGGRERDVPLADSTGLALSAHLAYAVPVTLPWHEPGTRRHGRLHTATLLFTTPDGRALDRNAFNATVWRPAREAAGLDHDRVNGCHMLRHVYASTLISRGVDVRTVAEYLGHSDGGALVLRTYSHLMPDAEDRARRAIEDAIAEARNEDHGPSTARGEAECP